MVPFFKKSYFKIDIDHIPDEKKCGVIFQIHCDKAPDDTSLKILLD